MVLYSAVSSPLDRSKRFTLSSPGRPVHSDTVLGFSYSPRQSEQIMCCYNYNPEIHDTPSICVSVQIHSLLVELTLSTKLIMMSSFEILHTPPPRVRAFLSFLKTLKLAIEGFNTNCVPQIRSGLSRMFRTSTYAFIFLLKWHVIRKFDLFFVLCLLLFRSLFDDVGER